MLFETLDLGNPKYESHADLEAEKNSLDVGKLNLPEEEHLRDLETYGITGEFNLEENNVVSKTKSCIIFYFW